LAVRLKGGKGFGVEFVELLKVIILGVVEGITEWLPISSTGHMILADEFIKLSVTDAFKEMFFVVIQLGAILAVVVLYFRKLNPFSFEKTAKIRKDTLSLWLKILTACLPAAVIGLLFDDLLDKWFYNYITVALMLILYGVLFIVIENRSKGKTPKIQDMGALSYKTAALIGVFQLLALIPGTSRSGATILGAILLGASRAIAAEFSFFLAIPVMLGARALKLVKFGFDFSGGELLMLLVGMGTAFLVSVAAIKLLMGYIKKHDFKAFGYYRIALGLIVVVYFLL
jgi:undecaprenyl-diphosphatase